MTRKRSKGKARKQSGGVTPTPAPVEVTTSPTTADAADLSSSNTESTDDAAGAPAAEARAASQPPPAEEVAASDDLAVGFFSAPPVTHPIYPVDEPATADAASERPGRRLVSDTAVARRRDFARYVTGRGCACA